MNRRSGSCSVRVHMKRLMYSLIPATASGLAVALCFPRFNLFFLAWAALLPLLWRCRELSPVQGALHFFWAGFVFYLVLLHWLMANVFWAGGWAFVGYVLLSLVMAAYWGVLGAVWRAVAPHLPAWAGALLLLPSLWFLMEFLQARLFTGFGWGALAYSQGPHLSLLQWAAVGGTGLVSAMLVASNGLLAAALTMQRRRWAPVVLAIVIAIAAHAGGSAMLEAPEYNDDSPVAGIIQPNFSQEMKWDPAFAHAMVTLTADASRALTERGPVDLFVWPEALIMVPFELAPDEERAPADEVDVDSQVAMQIRELAQDTGAALFTGAHGWHDVRRGWINAGLLFNRDGEPADHYTKVHLTPFGEYVPFADYLPFVDQLVPAIGRILPGYEHKTLESNGHRFGPMICFEVLFAPIAEQLYRDGADSLMVITNLAWFGGSAAIEQELAIARLRAIETRLPLLHAANTGITGQYDPWGRFTLVDTAFRSGRPYDARSLPPLDAAPIAEGVMPAHTIQERAGGRFRIPKPGARPWQAGPRTAPWLFAGVAVALAAVAYYRRTRGAT